MGKEKGKGQGEEITGEKELAALESKIAAAEQILRTEYFERPAFPQPIFRSTAELSRSSAQAYLRVREDSQELVEHAWQVYSGALRTTISGGENWPNLQLVAPAAPEPILWDDPVFGPYYFHGVAANLLNATGSVYKKTSNEFASRYIAFLTDVKRTPVNEEAEKKAQETVKEWRLAGADQGELYLSINLQWKDFDARQRAGLDPSQWLTMDEWFEMTDSNRILAAGRELRDLKYAKYLYWMQQAYGGGETLYRLLKQLENNKPIEVTLPGLAAGQTGGKGELYPYQISPDYPSWLQRVSQSSNPISFTVKSDSYQYDYSRTSIAGGIGIGFGFFGLFAGGRRTTVSIDTRRSGFELTFKADIQPFEILPGRWYDSTAFPLFHDGPFFPGSPIDNLYQRGALWGPNGFLNFRPARAIVAYKPEVKVKLRETEYHYFKQVTSGAAGFFVGPFAVGIGSYYDVRESVRWDDRSFELSLFNAPSIPHLLAFDSEVIG